MSDIYLLGDPCPECGWPSYTQDVSGGISCNGCGHVTHVGVAEELEPEPETSAPTGNTVWKYTAVDPLLIREERWDELPFPDDAWSPLCSADTIIELIPLDLTTDIDHIRLFYECVRSTAMDEGCLGTTTTQELKDMGIEISSVFPKFERDVIDVHRQIDHFVNNTKVREEMDVVMIRTSDGYYFISDINTTKLSGTGPMTSQSEANLRLAMMITTINPITAEEYK